ncbi:MAG: lysine--tRNA ligase [Candidatus Sericytochromatia bacterium]|nr:lysine--tRNA ligase [Candidatus Sericytochromatia bacterium]
MKLLFRRRTCVTIDLEQLPEQARVRRTKLQALKEQGVDVYPTRYDRSVTAADLQGRYEALEAGADTEDVVRVAGRLMGRRGQGKLVFADLVDETGKIQITFSLDKLGTAWMERLDLLDLGDILGVEGTVRRTKRGELSVAAGQWTFLSKCLNPLPEKWHGLADVELRYRQRYLDLIVNPETRDVFRKRSLVIRTLRRMLEDKGFIEVETPMLQAIPGGAAARPFHTHHNALDMPLHLRISPELYLKRLVVGGFEKVFDLNKNFRNEGISTRHNPEFTMMELYQAYVDYRDIMELTEELVCGAIEAACGGLKIPYQGETLDFTRPWRRATMSDLIQEKLGVDVAAMSVEELSALAARVQAKKPALPTHGHLVNEIFEAVAEGDLIQPTFVIDHPVEISPLAKRKPEMPHLTERFEVFVAGRELGNAFTELNDPIDQRERFAAQLKEREAGNDEAHTIDEDYLNALELGLPPTGGLGIGIDRLVMLVADTASIRDVILFPHMRPRE